MLKDARQLTKWRLETSIPRNVVWTPVTQGSIERNLDLFLPVFNYFKRERLSKPLLYLFKKTKKIIAPGGNK